MGTEEQKALQTARVLIELGHSLDVILSSPLIAAELRDFVRNELDREQNFILAPARTVTAESDRMNWLHSLDRQNWHYWPALRQFLLTNKKWNITALRSLDDSSDRILQQLEPPDTEHFDKRGLVLGYVQSGKTANFTALIAKAADAGYRLMIVLSGIDKGLRRQTQLRLKRELVGYPENRPDAVPLPPMGLQWHEFTSEDLDGDFQPGLANHAALQGSQPVLLVVKKNGAVLRRLLRWLNEAPLEVRRTIPLLMIDDEADQASVDIRGSYQNEVVAEEDPLDPDYEAPSVINGLIRTLLSRFERCAYVAYTATPFANILIPHDTTAPDVGDDLYPRDFIVDLPKPTGYFGAEELFGRMDEDDGSESTTGGMDIIREVDDVDLATLECGSWPESLESAILDFMLAGAARAERSDGDPPATMLIHTGRLIAEHSRLRELVAVRCSELRDEWRYQRVHGIRERLEQRWNSEFRPIIRNRHANQDVEFVTIEPFVGPFLEALHVKEINSAAGDVLDYEREPSLKAIAIGGNRLSRGLTLDGLLVSYFVRRSVTYDTLMQMGRWFGFRAGYEDLTRIYTTAELSGWFSDLAFVEHRLREDIGVYEDRGLTPREVGMRIWQHPTMQVTGPLKRRFASDITIAQSYRLALEQTFKFPLKRLEDLAVQAEANRFAVQNLATQLGAPDYGHSDRKGPVWTGIDADTILAFLREFRIDDTARSISLELVRAYIERLVDVNELIRWTIAVRGRETLDRELGEADWHLPTGPVNQISRSRLGDRESVGVITSPGDELAGLSPEQRELANATVQTAQAAGHSKSINLAAREVRPSTDGLLILYPISRHSRPERTEGGNRRPLYAEPDGPLARDLVGLAISFPDSMQPQMVEAYLVGTVNWRLAE